MFEYSSQLCFRIDPSLTSDLRRNLELALKDFRDSEIEILSNAPAKEDNKFIIEFMSENSPHLRTPRTTFKVIILNRNQDLFSFGISSDQSPADAVLDDEVSSMQIHCLIAHSLESHLWGLRRDVSLTGVKNIRKLESKVKVLSLKKDTFPGFCSSADLLGYAQALVDLEKDLIHSEDLGRQEKVLRRFVKLHLQKAKFQFFTTENLSRIQHGPNLLLLPSYRENFLCMELNWEDEDFSGLIKKILFYSTLVGFFSTGQMKGDSFFDEKLWESVLDNIPFPIALLSRKAEVYQHNTLFSKLGMSPSECLLLNQREKILISGIPYNVFREELHHLSESKILFVFFTESFILKGEGNLTPTGQELGIICSSIAHELNNPIAGIQAAVTLLKLDESASEEASQTLQEMKNGSVRCKQLIETFLGFSSRSPRSLQTYQNDLSPIEICYSQAQNLLRFRTVESGIRFSFESSRHATFRAPVNVSLLTMTFYLLLGEVMTLYSHYLLVADKNQIEKVIRAEIIESSQEVTIQLLELNISSLKLSKLIENLLNIENFVLQISDYSLRFIYNPPRDV